MNGPEESVAYAEHLHHEHRRLNRLLLDISHDVVQLRGPNVDQGLLQRLEARFTDLCDQLKVHFAEEEAGGCLEEAATRCPSLAGDIKTIFEEHHILDQLLCRLLSEVSDTAAKPADIQASWQAFYDKVRTHEAAETRLLRMAFGSESAELDTEDDD
jgi:iron-sulfur cluster repair protein YtfE (RIC family)